MYKSEIYGKGGIYAKVVTDSTANGVRATTMELRYPRFIHSEFMTHRVFSRNASSSRAIPVAKNIEQVKENPAMPIFWGKNQKGMQAREENYTPIGFAPFQTSVPIFREDAWKYASLVAIAYAKQFEAAGYHKQIVNRLLEPFQFISVIVTSTEWDNFFSLRLHPDAQPEIQELAKCMKEARNQSFPFVFEEGMWHTPYIDGGVSKGYNGQQIENIVKCSAARCARVSYLNHDNSLPDYEKDLVLAHRLLESKHMSPFEHQLTPIPAFDFDDPEEIYKDQWEKGVTHIDRNGILWSGNMRGWIQYRQIIQN